MAGPYSPSRLIKLYQDHRDGEVGEKTHRNNWGHPRDFREWCERNDVDDLRDLTGLELRSFGVRLKQDREPTTIRNHISTVRTFLRWLHRVDVLGKNLAHALESPDGPDEQKARDVMTEPEEVETLLDYFDRFEYATVRHVVLVLLWHAAVGWGHSGRSTSKTTCPTRRPQPTTASSSSDTDPNTDTALKNAEGGERKPCIRPDYCEGRRRRHPDEPAGRAGRTRQEPARHQQERSVPRELVSGDGLRDDPALLLHQRVPPRQGLGGLRSGSVRVGRQAPVECLASPGRGSITYHLREKDWGYDASQRFDVSVKVLKKHYDRTTEDDRRDRRASPYLDTEDGTLYSRTNHPKSLRSTWFETHNEPALSKPPAVDRDGGRDTEGVFSNSLSLFPIALW